MTLKLVIGSKNYSSWSMRPWLALAHHKIPFDEVVIPLDQPDTRSRILQYSPAGKVPVLIDGGATVWETLAILEHLNERFPQTHFGPGKRRCGRTRAQLRRKCTAALRPCGDIVR